MKYNFKAIPGYTSYRDHMTDFEYRTAKAAVVNCKNVGDTINISNKQDPKYTATVMAITPDADGWGRIRLEMLGQSVTAKTLELCFKAIPDGEQPEPTPATGDEPTPATGDPAPGDFDPEAIAELEAKFAAAKDNYKTILGGADTAREAAEQAKGELTKATEESQKAYEDYETSREMTENAAKQAEQAKQQAEQAKQQAENAMQKAEEAKQKAEQATEASKQAQEECKQDFSVDNMMRAAEAEKEAQKAREEAQKAEEDFNEASKQAEQASKEATKAEEELKWAGVAEESLKADLAHAETKEKNLREYAQQSEEEHRQMQEELSQAEEAMKKAEEELRKAEEQKPQPQPAPTPQPQPQPAPAPAPGLIRHPKLNRIIEDLNLGFIPYLYGPAGTGKNTIAEQVAEELGVPFFTTGCLTMKYELEGYMDANGRFVETDFYKAIQQPSVFFLDEVDCTGAEVLKAFNALLANGYYSFPCGTIHKHPDCRIIAAGNSTGTGQDLAYIAGQTLDKSTLDRFVGEEIDYCKAIDMAAAKKDAKLVEAFKEIRKAIKEAQLPYVASPRSLKRIATLREATKRSIKDILSVSLLWSWDKEDIRTIANMIPEDPENEYMTEFKKLG